ncbi:MAG: carotenoid oxygenase family protein [Hydrococcus sp. Prado102]|jgi:all-trans-8'-apo-beta-carotenal 15,15'-oxygenase|nr:carotenoid oxygenase family protein [Hydrococcus sp. Prado102]
MTVTNNSPLTRNKTDKSYNRQDWKKGYDSQPNEYDYWVDDIEGEIPNELEGTLFRNGPGLLDIHGTPIRHPFDGDGMISAISFQNGRVHYRNRFVRTEGYVKEREVGKILYRGVFGTSKPGGFFNNAFDLKLKNIANTNVIYWGGKLLALWEAAEPHRLDPATLETLGLDYLDGLLEPGDAFSAHPWVDPSCEMDGGEPCLVNYSIKTGLSSTITIFEFNDDGKLLRRHAHSIPGFCFIHDFVITPHYCIFFQNPVVFNPLPFVLGWRGAGECVQYQPKQPTRIIVIPRIAPYQGVKILETQAGFVFHHANAFELEDKICIDSICYDSLPQVNPDISYKEVDFDALSPGQLWRFTLDLKNETVQRQMLESRCCEFPTLDPDKVGRSYRYLFIGAAHDATGNAPLQAILKIDWQSGDRQLHSFAPKGYISEPVFVPRPNAQAEDDGWVLTLVYDSDRHRSDVVILDGRNLNREPIATVHLKHHIPYGLHGNWVDKVFNG